MACGVAFHNPPAELDHELGHCKHAPAPSLVIVNLEGIVLVACVGERRAVLNDPVVRVGPQHFFCPSTCMFFLSTSSGRHNGGIILQSMLVSASFMRDSHKPLFFVATL